MIISIIVQLALSYILHTQEVVVHSFDAQVLVSKEASNQLNIIADKGAVLDYQDRAFLYSKKANEEQAIASITKLMTALVFLEHNPGWDKEYEIGKKDMVSGGKVRLFLGDKVTVNDLFHLSLIASDNGATLALVNSTGLSEEEFVSLMNQQAKLLGLSRTHFVDPIGLGEGNVSTAKELAYFAREVLNNSVILKTLSQNRYSFKTSNGKNINAESTDYLLSAKNIDFHILGGKTGYTDQAGYCFLSLLTMNNKKYISVILNSDSVNNRFRDTKKIISWVINNYN